MGCNSYIGEGCQVSETVILGNDTYTNDASRAASRKKGEVVLGIGKDLLQHSMAIYNPEDNPLPAMWA